MTIKKLFATVCASVLLITALCGCSLNTEETVPAPDYTQVTELVTAYEDAYREYVQTGDGGGCAQNISSAHRFPA